MWNKIRIWAGYDRDRLKVEPRPLFDWWLLSVGTIILLFLLFGGYLLMMRQINGLEASSDSLTATSTVSFNRETLDKLTEGIAKRQAEFQTLLETRPSLPNPAR